MRALYLVAALLFEFPLIPALAQAQRFFDPPTPDIARTVLPRGVSSPEIAPSPASRGWTGQTTGGWLGQELITNPLLEDKYFWSTIYFDTHGVPWAFWVSLKPDSKWVMEYSRFENGIWSPPENGPNLGGPGFPNNEHIVFDDSDTLWAVWCQYGGVDYDYDIYYQRSFGTSWDIPKRLHPENSLVDFHPNVGRGGGQTWVVWYSGETVSSDYRIKVSRWLDGTWSGPTEISSDIPGFHWFPNIAVGPDGVAHVVWGESYQQLIYYKEGYPDGTWSETAIINPRMFGVAAADWAAPSIAIDSEGRVHVAWVGQRIKPDKTLEDWDIFYSYFDGHSWASPRQVNPDNQTGDAYPSLALISPHDMWITWYGGNPASTERATVLAVRWNGTQALEVSRLDDDTNWANGVPSIALDRIGRPWVVWDTIGENYTPGEVLLNRYDGPVPVTLSDFRVVSHSDRVSVTWWAASRMFSRFVVERSRGSDFTALATIPDDGREEYLWSDSPPLLGRWWYRLKGMANEGSIVTLGPVPTDFGGFPARLSMRIVDGGLSSDARRIRLGLPQAGSLHLVLADTQGRILDDRLVPDLPQGWNEISWTAPVLSGNRLASGVYFLAARSGNEEVAVKLVMLR